MINMKRNVYTIVAVVLVLLLIAGCAPRVNGVKKDLSYDDILKKNTVSGKDYSQFETKLIAGATYKDMDFITAQINKKGQDLYYDSRKMNQLISEAQRDDVFYVSFFVAVYTPDDRYADFSPKKGLWKFYLKKGHYELIQAQKVQRVARSYLAEYEMLYPYISTWMQGYEVFFSRSELYNVLGSRDLFRPFSLLITGQFGKLELTFE